MVVVPIMRDELEKGTAREPCVIVALIPFHDGTGEHQNWTTPSKGSGARHEEQTREKGPARKTCGVSSKNEPR